MSYEPTIICEYGDLVEHEHILYVDANHDDRCAKWILKSIEGCVVEFKGSKLVIFTPEFTTFNAEVQQYLDTLGIEYATYGS